MKLVKDLGNPREGGSCSQCNADYRASDGRKFLMRYGKEGIVEPFNMCATCAQHVSEYGEI